MTLGVVGCWSAGARADPAPSFEVAGSCRLTQAGQLVVLLVDERRFSVPGSGLLVQTFDIAASKGQAAEPRFSFRLPPGRYGIRCFLDINGNGMLDRGLFGPAEPWGMSWTRRRINAFPQFSDISFLVDRDITLPCMSVE